MAWLSETWDTYFANATARRDFRTQLRGAKPILLWSAYLILLIFVGMTMYAGLESGGEQSIATLQSSLKGFYQTIVMLLSGTIIVIAPALTAATIASERQRRSLDLVLSTPMQIKHYLVGKLIGSYRYTWMLLLLSLPLVSMCVILGGATWLDVITTFFKLSLFGLLFTAIGLLISVLAPKPVSAVVYTYATVGGYIFLTWAISDAFGPWSGPTSFLTTLNPFYIAFDYDPYYGMMPAPENTCLFLTIFVLVACKFLLLGTASAMSRYGSAETKSFRVHSLVLACLIGFLVSYYATSPSAAVTSMTPPPTSTVTPYLYGDEIGTLICYFAVLIHWITPFIACSSATAERRNQPDGFFSFRKILMATPASALPFMLSLVLLFALGVVGGLLATGSVFELTPLLDATMWSAGFLTFIWSLCRLASSMNKDLTNTRGTAMFLIVCALLIPVPILMALSQDTPNIWLIYPLNAVFDNTWGRQLAGFVMFVAGLAIAYVASWNRKAQRIRPI